MTRRYPHFALGVFMLLYSGCSPWTTSYSNVFPREDSLNPARGKIRACLELREVRVNYSSPYGYGAGEYDGQDYYENWYADGILEALDDSMESSNYFTCDDQAKSILFDVDITQTITKMPGTPGTCLRMILPIKMKSEMSLDCDFSTLTSSGSPIKRYSLSFVAAAEGSLHAGIIRNKEMSKEYFGFLVEHMLKIMADDWASYRDYIETR